MTNFDENQLRAIQESAWMIADNDDRVTSDVIRDVLASYLYEERDRWATFDLDDDLEAYEPVLDEFFAKLDQLKAAASAAAQLVKNMGDEPVRPSTVDLIVDNLVAAAVYKTPRQIGELVSFIARSVAYDWPLGRD